MLIVSPFYRMIARKNRFHGRAAIRRLQSTGAMVRSGVFGLRYAPNPKRSSYRLAVVVSRKVSKSAVVRNRIRRRLYERVRILFNDLPDSYDLTVVVYDMQVALMPSDVLNAELAKLLARAKLDSINPGVHDIVKPKG